MFEKKKRIGFIFVITVFIFIATIILILIFVSIEVVFTGRAEILETNQIQLTLQSERIKQFENRNEVTAVIAEQTIELQIFNIAINPENALFFDVILTPNILLDFVVGSFISINILEESTPLWQYIVSTIF